MGAPWPFHEVEQLKALAADPAVTQRRAAKILGKTEGAVARACSRRNILWNTNHPLGKLVFERAQKRRTEGFIPKVQLVGKAKIVERVLTEQEIADVKEYAARPDMTLKYAAWNMDMSPRDFRQVLKQLGIVWICRNGRPRRNSSKKRVTVIAGVPPMLTRSVPRYSPPMPGREAISPGGNF